MVAAASPDIRMLPAALRAAITRTRPIHDPDFDFEDELDVQFVRIIRDYGWTLARLDGRLVTEADFAVEFPGPSIENTPFEPVK